MDIIYNPIINYLIMLMIYAQMPFFMWLYESDYNIDWFEVPFMFFITVFAPVTVYYYKFSFHYYTTQLLITYMYLIFYAWFYLREFWNYDFKSALSLSFLIVFLNSYYWEIVLTIAAAHTNIYELINPRETIRLIIVPFFLNNFNFDKHKANLLLRKGIIVSGLIAYFRLKRFRIDGKWVVMYSMPIFGTWGNFLYIVNRFICLWILLKILTDCARPKKDAKKWFH